MDINTDLEQRRDRLRLVCPACRGKRPLLTSSAGYDCGDCERNYPLLQGWPDMIIGERFDDASDDTLLRYEERSNEDLTRNYWIPMFRRLWPEAGAERRLLSVGCGTGVDVDLLRDQGYDSVGIDCGNRTAVWPRRTHGDRLLLANGKHLPFGDNSFDATFCGCVFPHIGVVGDSNVTADDVDAQRLELASEMVRVLRPGGWIVVSSPNRWFPFDIFHGRQPGSYKPRWNPPGSRFLLSMGDYQRLFQAAGTGPATVQPVENYWGFIRSKHSVKGVVFGTPVRMVFWLVSRPAFAFLRRSPLNPWLVVTLQKLPKGSRP